MKFFRAEILFQQFLNSKQDLQAQQCDILFEKILAGNTETAFGQNHEFARLSDVQQFSKQVPLCDYESIRAQVDQMAAGQQGILTDERVIAFFKTSGSLSEPKLIPVTASLMREKVSAFATFWGHVYEQYPAIKDGAMVANFTDASSSETTQAGIEVTSESGFWARRGRALHSLKRWPLPAEVRLIQDPEARLYATARLLLQSDLNCIMCLNPSTLLQFCKSIEQHATELVRGLSTGQWGTESEAILNSLQAPELAKLQPYLECVPDRASRLTRACSSAAKPQLKRLWPELDLLICWCSKGVQPYFAPLQAYIEGLAIRDYITQSSECMMAIPVNDGDSGGVLAYQSHFFEFIPESMADQPDPPTQYAWQLEVGSRYELVVTTGGGLYRYRMGDCIQVNGFDQSVPIIEFQYRLGKTSSMSGEKLTEYQVLDAAEKASRMTGIEPREFLCFPMTRPQLRYGLLFDPGDEAISDDSLLHWVHTFDEQLGLVNNEYRDKCESARLATMQACRVAPGALWQAAGQRRISQSANR